MISYSRQDAGFNGRNYYYKTHWPTNWNRSSTLGLTMAGGTMVHKRYYELYSKEKDAMALVDEVHNCEDILMNWVIAKDLKQRNITSGVAVYMYPFFPAFPPKPNLPNQTIESKGISTRPGHYEKRTACVQKFVQMFGFPITEYIPWSVGWHPNCTLQMVGCRFPLQYEPKLNARTCVYSYETRNDVYA
mmetsp:Transcript_8396/g.14718  ORF Transcript_8396/g.14718 Transcript_8396/m.14718 type:complete len:189 (-) Transcript_8396:263-829(-)